MPNPTPCAPLIDPGCHPKPLGPRLPSRGRPDIDIPNPIDTVTGSAVDGIATAIQKAIGWVVSNTISWWVQLDSPDLEKQPAVANLQHLMLPITVMVAVIAMLAAAAKMTLSRKANPLIDIGSGLALIAATGAIGIALPNLLLEFGDAWTRWAIDAASDGDFERRMTTLVSLTGAPSGVVVVLGIVSLLIAAIQAILMLFREGAILVLAGVLPLAAAGTLTGATRPWFKRITGWLLALIFYKPAAAAVYATMFTLIGKGSGAKAILMGLAMMIVSLVAFPVLLKFFTWTTGAIDTGGSGSILNTLIGSATAIGTLQGFSGLYRNLSAGEHANFINRQLGDQGQRQQNQPPDPPSRPQQDRGPTQQSDDGAGQHPQGDRGPNGSEQPDKRSPTTSRQSEPPGGATTDPVGPTVVRTGERAYRQAQEKAQEAVRWIGFPGGGGGAKGGGSGGG